MECVDADLVPSEYSIAAPRGSAAKQRNDIHI